MSNTGNLAASVPSLQLASGDSMPVVGLGTWKLEQSPVRQAARRHGKSAAQTVLRWGVQRGTAIVPKTSRPGRLAENLDLFDFELAADEMQAIGSLDRGRRFNDPGEFCEGAFHTFFPIYE